MSIETELTQEQIINTEENSDENEIDTSIESSNLEDEPIEISASSLISEKINSNFENSQISTQENTEDITFTTVIHKKRRYIESKPYKIINKENQYDELEQRTQSNSKNQ